MEKTSLEKLIYSLSNRQFRNIKKNLEHGWRSMNGVENREKFVDKKKL